MALAESGRAEIIIVRRGEKKQLSLAQLKNQTWFPCFCGIVCLCAT